MKWIKFVVFFSVGLISFVRIVSAAPSAKPIDLKESLTSAVVVDARTGQVLATRNATKLGMIASQSKMLTAYAALRAIHDGKLTWDTPIPITNKADLSHQPKYVYSHLDIKAGDHLTVRELYNAMLTISANDASFALSEYLTPKGMTTQAALQSWANELKLDHSKWYNAAGQVNGNAFENKIAHEPGEAANLASAEHLAMLAREIIKLDPNIRTLGESDFISYKSASANRTVKLTTDQFLFRHQHSKKVSNPNHLIIEGLKTGSTPESGAAFTGIVKDQAGHEFITVVNGAGYYTDTVTRYQETINIVNDVLKSQVPETFEAGSVLSDCKKVKMLDMKRKEVPVVVGQTKTFWHQKQAPIKVNHTTLSRHPKKVARGQSVALAQLALPDVVFLPNTSVNSRNLLLKSTIDTTQAPWWTRVWRDIFG